MMHNVESESYSRIILVQFQVRGDGGLLEYRKARSFEVCEDDHRTGRFLPQDVRCHSFGNLLTALTPAISVTRDYLQVN